MSKTEYKSRVYTDRPDYADFDAPAKFQAISAIIARRLREHPNAICSYSGGADSDIMIDLIERTRKMHRLPPVKYAFFNTGLEMKATKDHVKEVAEKYGVEIETFRPNVNIVMATREHGIPFMSKFFSQRINEWQIKNIPLSIVNEFNSSTNKYEKLKELEEKFPKSKALIQFLCSCDNRGEPWSVGHMRINSEKYMLDFIREYPPDFQISAKCCDYCKKQLAHRVQKGFDMVITGERMAEGGIRATSKQMLETNPLNTMCFFEQSNGQHRLRPLYYVSDKDKQWYKDYYGIRYSDAYEVYGLTRTGCCGCAISYKAVEDLEKIRPYEPNVVKAAWNIFGASYRYRQKYNEYKRKRMDEEKKARKKVGGQIDLFGEAEP